MKRRFLFNRVLGFVALATFLVSFVSPIDSIQDLRPGDDAACGQVQWFSGHPDMRIGAGQVAPIPQHCPYCHFLRAVSGASPMAVTVFVRPDHLTLVASATPRRMGATVVDQRLSRAPPSLVIN